MPVVLFAQAATPNNWFDHPLFMLGEVPFTVLSLLKIVLWVVGLLVAVGLLQRIVLQRLLARTHLDHGLQFAVNRITGYVLVILGLYIALVVNGFNLRACLKSPVRAKN
jgi:small-conductance mechanosensitive channel